MLCLPFPSPFHCARRRGNSTQMDVELLGAWNEGVADGRGWIGVDSVGGTQELRGQGLEWAMEWVTSGLSTNRAKQRSGCRRSQRAIRGVVRFKPRKCYFKVNTSVAVSVLYVRPLPISKPLNPSGALTTQSFLSSIPRFDIP